MTVDRDILMDYVMGSLTPAQESEVADYLNAYPEDAAWVRDLFETLAAVALAQAPAEVPADAADALLQRVRAGDNPPATAPASNAPDEAAPKKTHPRETTPADTTFGETRQVSGTQQPVVQDTGPRRSRRNPWLGLALAAALAVVAWLGLRPALETYQVAQRLDRLCGEAGVTCEALVNDSNQSLGTLAVRPNNALYVVFDAEPPAGQVYQAWEIVGGTPQSLGVYGGRVLDISQTVSPESTFGVSVEPPGGSPQPTSTPIVVLPLAG